MESFDDECDYVEDDLSAFTIHSCEYCRHIILDLSSTETLEHDQIFVLATNRRQERHASRSGCQIFRFAAYGAHPQYSQDDFEDEVPYQNFKLVLRFAKGWHSAGIGAITSYWTENTDNSWNAQLHFLPQPRKQYAILPAKDNVAPSIIKRRLPRRDVASLTTLNILQRWIETCDHKHTCRNKNNESWLPTRLIEISDVDGYLSARITRPVSGEKIEYAVLSYAWGQTGMLHRYLRLNTARIEETDEIPLGTIPETLLDAIKLTYRLGLRHLWVDCLCILQNDVQDKIKEIGAMAKIFESAYIVISAASAASSDEGFLQPRNLDKDLRRCVKLQVRLPGEEMSHAYLFTPELSYAPKQEPLNRRAWTLQESLLATRKLVFNSQTVSWSCRELAYDTNSELWQKDWKPEAESTGTSQMSANEILTGNGFNQAIASIINHDLDLNVRSTALRGLWEAIVMDYTNRELSEATDRAVAISGIAERLGRASGDIYLAGLWQSQLPRALMWQAHPSDSPWARSYLHLHGRLPGPTWSWTTIDGRVRSVSHTPYLESVEALVDIIACHTEPLSQEAPYSVVKTGTIRLEGYIEEMYHVAFTHESQWYDLDGNQRDVDFSSDALASDTKDIKLGVDIPIPVSDMPEGSGNTEEADQDFQDSESTDSSDFAPIDGRETAKSSGIKVSLLYMFSCASKDKGESFYDGLVLLPTEAGGYRRIGTFTNRFSNDPDEVPYQAIDSLGLKEIVLV